MNIFNPKALILSAVKDKLKASGIDIDTIFFAFKFDGDEMTDSRVLIQKGDENPENFYLDEADKTKIKQIFLKKLSKKLDEKPEHIAISIDLKNSDIEIFYQLPNSDVLQKLNF